MPVGRLTDAARREIPASLQPQEGHQLRLRLIPDNCDQGSFAFTIKGHPVPGMRVDAQRHFSAHYQPSSHETIDVTGKFSKSFHRASGTLRDQGDFPPQATGCDTGVDKWAASKLNVTGG